MPRKHMDEIVIPNVEDFKRNYGDIRHGFNAVAAVDALVGHLYCWCEKNAPSEVDSIDDDTHYRQHLGEKCPDLLLLRDIAKAQKHVKLVRGSPDISSADQVSSRTIGWGEGQWGGGRWGGPNQVVVNANSGKLRYVEAIVQKSLSFLQSEMERLKVP